MKTQPKIDALSDHDLDKIANLLDSQFDKRLAPLATKVFVEEQIEGVKDDIAGLKTYMNEGFETVMNGLDDLSKQMAEKEKVERLVKWAKEASKRIGVVIDI